MSKKDVSKINLDEAVGITDKETLKKLINEISNFKYLSPWVISSRYGVKMGDAKRMLKFLEKHGLVILVFKDHRNPIYKPA